jgi:hypothetical protein
MRSPEETEERQALLRPEPRQILPPPRLPWPAKKAIIVATILCFLGFVCFALSLATWFSGSFMGRNRNSRWPLFVLGVLALPSGVYTLYLAWLIYNRTPGYYWPMIFL